MPSSRSSPEVVTPTGWRIVGEGAGAYLSGPGGASSGSAHDRVRPGAPANLIWAVSCTLEPRRSGVNAVDRVLEALARDLRKGWPDAPLPRRDEGFEHPASRFGGVSWRVDPAPGKAWRGEALFRTVHPRVPGAPLTIRVLLEEMRSFIRLSAAVWADDGAGSVRGDVGAGQVTPPFVDALHETLQVTWMGSPLRPRTLLPGDEPDFIRSVLEAPARPVPVVLLTPHEDGTFVVDPEALARDLLGRAQLYVIRDHRQTFRITDGLGDRRLSAFFGAARVYYPGFTRHDDPMDHTLLVADRLSDPLMRAAFLGEIGRRTAPDQKLPEGIEAPEEEALPEPVPEPSPEPAPDRAGAPSAAQVPEPLPKPDAGERAAAADGPPPEQVPQEARVDGGAQDSASQAPETPAPAPPPTPAPDPGFGALAEALLRQAEATVRELQALRSGVAELRGEVERLATVSGLRNASTAHVERRLVRIEDILERSFPDPDAPGADAPAKGGGRAGAEDAEREGAPPESRSDTLEDVVRSAEERHADALLILPSAVDAARDSPYEDPERVREILRAMAAVSRRRQEGSLGTGLKEAFEAFGVDYRGGIATSTPERLRKQYLFHLEGGEGVECFEHIALGATYNPRRCLRIYFSSKLVTDSRFVIGHVGRHFEVLSST